MPRTTPPLPAGSLAGAVPGKLLSHALLLIAREHGGDAATAQAARAELARWRRESPMHEAAAEAARRGWESTDASELRDAVPLPPMQGAREAGSRRRVISALGLAGLAAALGATGRWYWLQPLEQLALHTGRGQMLPRRLQDGSLLALGPRTDVGATIYRDRREVRLSAGEIHVEVRPDATRPFTVITEWGRVRVLGTVFTVAVRAQSMVVAVAEGRVAVWSARDGDGNGGDVARPPDAELVSGQTVRIEYHAMGAIGDIQSADVGAWRQGWLVFDRTPLPEAIARWNDYLPQPLTTSDETALRSLRLTGSFRVRDPGAFLDSLPGVLPVRVVRLPDGGARILPRR